MNVLYLQLYLTGETSAQLRFFADNPNDYEVRSLSLNAIADIIQQAEQGYYFPQDSRLLRKRLSVDDFTITGRKLFNWLDGSDRLLSRTMQQYSGERVVLAIDASQKLAHLPWEVLHDGSNFLVARTPAVVPVRWVSDVGARHVVPLQPPEQPENRALQVLFMATSPLGVKPELQFEAEEGRILEATARQPLALVVEESGCLKELGCLIDDYGKDYFDVLHLTGHATITEEGEPRFYTETETGELYLASAADIAKSLKSRLPQLIFLSGCRTGQGGKLGAVPSLAEGLLKLGAKAVLGWGQTVLDTEATTAAAALYGALAAGYEVTEALSGTYQELIRQQARDWHLLRLYVGRALPGQLVTTLRTPGRKRAPKPSVAEQFLDIDTRQVKVASRGSFVGRRRQLQNCLRALRGVAPLTPQFWGEQEAGQNLTPPRIGGQGGQCLGVLIHGMGGLGKSTLAARLCDRLPEFERIVWVGRVDEGSLVKRLTEKLRSKELRQVLQSYDDELKFRLRDVFERLEEEAAQPFLLVLDDFEGNLEPLTSPPNPLLRGEGSSSGSGYLLQPEAARVLEALLWAIEETYARHRVILTCRYDFASEWLQRFYKQPMDGLQGADLEKKCNRLSAFGVNSPVDEALREKALRLADGNPRLLEWLDKVLLDATVDRGAILQRLETNPVELREKVLATSLLEQIDGTLEGILRRGLVYELPVPREAIIAICTDIPHLEPQINRAVALGLLEVSSDASLRVPRILEKNLTPQPPSLPGKGEKDSPLLSLPLPEGEGVKGEGLGERLHQQAAEVLYRLWWQEAETSTEEQVLEIHRLALRGKVETIAVEIAATLAGRWANQSRFREAVKLCQATLEIAEDYRVLHGLARSERELGEVSQAQTHYQQALDSCPQDDEKEKSAIIHNLGYLKADSGEIEQAIALFQQSLEIKERIGNVQGKAATLHELGRLKANLGEIEEAIALFQQSLEIFKSIGDAQGKAATLHNLARLKADTGQIEEAIALYQKSLKITERIGDAQGKATTLAMLGQLLADEKGDLDTGLNYLQQSLEILQRIQSPHAETVRQIIARLQQ